MAFSPARLESNTPKKFRNVNGILFVRVVPILVTNIIRRIVDMEAAICPIRDTATLSIAAGVVIISYFFSLLLLNHSDVGKAVVPTVITMADTPSMIDRNSSSVVAVLPTRSTWTTSNLLSVLALLMILVVVSISSSSTVAAGRSNVRL